MSETLTAAPFTDAEKVDVRRYAGYPPYGTGIVMFPEVWYFRYYLALEARMQNLTAPEVAVIRARLTEIRTLETAVPGTGANLDTDRAAVWYHNKDELLDRMALYRTWRIELCNLLGIPPG